MRRGRWRGDKGRPPTSEPQLKTGDTGSHILSKCRLLHVPLKWCGHLATSQAKLTGRLFRVVHLQEQCVFVLSLLRVSATCHVHLKDARAQRVSRAAAPTQKLHDQTSSLTQSPYTDRLAGLVVKASASGAEDPGFDSRWRRDFSRGRVLPVTSKLALQWLRLPGAWRCRVSAGTGRPGVSIL